MKFICIALIAIIASCATIKPVLVTAGGAFAACGEADASGLFAQVGSIIAANAAIEGSLTALAATVGIDAVKCVIAALNALTTAPTTTEAVANVGPSGLARANAWAAVK